MKLQTTNYKLQTNTGFSLLETLVAISILMITIVGPLALASKGIVFADYVKDEITGFYLAQEAIEVIRNIRDTNIKSRSNWLEYIKGCVGEDKVCRLEVWAYNDPLTKGITICGAECSSGSNARKEWERLQFINIGNETGRIKLYGYDFPGNIRPDNGIRESSIFSRRITIVDKTPGQFPPYDRVSGIDEVGVTVEVTWVRASLRGKYAERSIKVSENMFNL